VKSLNRITNLRLKKLLIHLLKLRKGLSENVNEFHLQTVLLKAQQVQIFKATLRTMTSTSFIIELKKKADLKKISSKTAA